MVFDVKLIIRYRYVSMLNFTSLCKIDDLSLAVLISICCISLYTCWIYDFLYLLKFLSFLLGKNAASDQGLCCLPLIQ